jgi:hypothetical protein
VIDKCDWIQHAGSKDGHSKIFIPDPVRIDSEDGLPMRTLVLDLDETLVHTEFDVFPPSSRPFLPDTRLLILIDANRSNNEDGSRTVDRA